MRISDIISRGQSYLLLGLMAAAVISVLILLGYFVFYKKIMKGERTFPFYKILLFDLFICYLTIVIGAVFLDRGTGIYNWSNLHFLSSYRVAWYKWSSVEWRYILLNILLFIPMGALLPLLTKKLQKLWKISIVGLSVTLLIESVQYLSGLGIFEIDDIFNNFLGILVGGGVVMGVINLRKKENSKVKAFLYFIPFVTIVLCFVSIFTFYNMREFGNMADAFYYKQNMNNVELSCMIELADDKPSVGVYSAAVLKETDARIFAEQFFTRIGASLDNGRPPQIYDGSAYYYSDNECILSVNYKAKLYQYIDFTNSDSEKDASAQETALRDLLSQYGIHIPNDAEYINNKNGDYTFHVDMKKTGEHFIDGGLTCTYYKDGTIKNIDNHLVECTYVRDCRIISQNEALKQIEEGKFNFYDKELSSIQIVAVELAYTLDSKGFYQPVYRFSVIINESEYDMDIIIPALGK